MDTSTDSPADLRAHAESQLTEPDPSIDPAADVGTSDTLPTDPPRPRPSAEAIAAGAFCVAPAELVPAIAGLRAAADTLDQAGYGKTIGAAVAQVHRIATAVETYMDRVVAYDKAIATGGADAADALKAQWDAEDAAAKGAAS